MVSCLGSQIEGPFLRAEEHPLGDQEEADG